MYSAGTKFLILCWGENVSFLEKCLLGGSSIDPWENHPSVLQYKYITSYIQVARIRALLWGRKKPKNMPKLSWTNPVMHDKVVFQNKDPVRSTTPQKLTSRKCPSKKRRVPNNVSESFKRRIRLDEKIHIFALLFLVPKCSNRVDLIAENLAKFILYFETIPACTHQFW